MSEYFTGINNPYNSSAFGRLSIPSTAGPAGPTNYYTFNKEHSFRVRDAINQPYDRVSGPQGSGPNLVFLHRIIEGSSAYSCEIKSTDFISLSHGTVAFLCPTTLSNITGSIHFGFSNTNPNTIFLNIYKQPISSAYINLDTNKSLIFTSRFDYTPSALSKITVPVTVTSALTANDIVYVSFQMQKPSADSVVFFLTYTLNFS
jgi:hypothetical protein